MSSAKQDKQVWIGLCMVLFEEVAEQNGYTTNFLLDLS